MKIKLWYDNPDRTVYLFYCPGCKINHQFPVKGKEPIWSFNNNIDKPTITPSIRITALPSNYCCHSIITDGKIAFCGDSTHELKGQTVDLPDIV